MTLPTFGPRYEIIVTFFDASSGPQKSTFNRHTRAEGPL